MRTITLTADARAALKKMRAYLNRSGGQFPRFDMYTPQPNTFCLVSITNHEKGIHARYTGKCVGDLRSAIHFHGLDIVDKLVASKTISVTDLRDESMYALGYVYIDDKKVDNRYASAGNETYFLVDENKVKPNKPFDLKKINSTFMSQKRRDFSETVAFYAGSMIVDSRDMLLTAPGVDKYMTFTIGGDQFNLLNRVRAGTTLIGVENNHVHITTGGWDIWYDMQIIPYSNSFDELYTDKFKQMQEAEKYSTSSKIRFDGSALRSAVKQLKKRDTSRTSDLYVQILSGNIVVQTGDRKAWVEVPCSGYMSLEKFSVSWDDFVAVIPSGPADMYPLNVYDSRQNYTTIAMVNRNNDNHAYLSVSTQIYDFVKLVKAYPVPTNKRVLTYLGAVQNGGIEKRWE